MHSGQTPNLLWVALQVNFLPGTVELGLLQDMDRPLLSKLKHKRMKSPGPGDDHAEAVYTTDRETQTDGRLTRPPSQDFQMQVPERKVVPPQQQQQPPQRPQPAAAQSQQNKPTKA